jgi:hypothetical protein
MFKSDNSTNILIGKDLARTSSVQAIDGAAAAYIANGEILVLDELHAPLTAGDDIGDSPIIYVVQGRGGVNGANGLKWSTPIDGRNVVRATALSYAAPVAQVTHIGNVGAGALAIDVLPFTDYKLTIRYTHDDEMYSEQSNKRVFYYTTGASDTQLTIATAFVTAINAEDFYNATALVVNNGANYGIRLTGGALDFELGTFPYNVMTFDVQLSGFGVTPVTYTTAANLGSGTYEQIAELEWFCNGFNGVINRVHFPAPTGTQDATSGVTYDILAIEYFDSSENYAVSGTKPAKKLLYIALPVNASQTTQVLAQLNPWLASTPRQFAALSV